MKGFTIKVGGITEVTDKIIYNGVECIYHKKDDTHYWLQPLSVTEKISDLAGQGKSITCQEFENLKQKGKIK